MKVGEFINVPIVQIIDESPTVKRIFLQYPQPISFLAGQFIVLKFPGLAHQFETRSYSIADYTTDNIIEICVSIKTDGAATPILFNKNIGDSILASMPNGRFTLPENINTPISFICTGAGIAPFRAMIKYLLIEKKCSMPLTLYFGCRNIEDLLYYNEWLSLAETYTNFKYIPSLSRAKWNGKEGYIHKHYIENIKDLTPHLFYLCGWTGMIKETRDNLKQIGYERSQIKIEFYDS